MKEHFIDRVDTQQILLKKILDLLEKHTEHIKSIDKEIKNLKQEQCSGKKQATKKTS